MSGRQMYSPSGDQAPPVPVRSESRRREDTYNLPDTNNYLGAESQRRQDTYDLPDFSDYRLPSSSRGPQDGYDLPEFSEYRHPAASRRPQDDGLPAASDYAAADSRGEQHANDYLAYAPESRVLPQPNTNGNGYHAATSLGQEDTYNLPDANDFLAAENLRAQEDTHPPGNDMYLAAQTLRSPSSFYPEYDPNDHHHPAAEDTPLTPRGGAGAAHVPQNSLGGFSTSSDETYFERSDNDQEEEAAKILAGPSKYPEVFESLDTTRSLTPITALAPNTSSSSSPDKQSSSSIQYVDVDVVHPGEPRHVPDSSSPRGVEGDVEQTLTEIEKAAADDPYSPTRPRLPLRPRLAHFTWAWYTLTMSTGGLSLLIAAQPHTFPGLRSIGLTIYILNILLFTLVTTLLLTRFILYPRTFRQSITHKREAFFVPTFFLSLATLITSTQRYAVPDPEVSSVPAAPSLLWAIQTAFWIYLVLTTILAIAQYSHIFTAHRFGLHTMMPTWILPIFPIMLSGTIASVIAGTQPAEQAVAIITAGLTCQGLGLSVAVMMYAHMVGRLMTSGLPDREHRPGLFMCVGPPAFTALAFLGLSRSLPANFDVDDDGFLDTSGIRTTAIIGAGYLWALSFWWFGIAVIAVAIRPPRYFHLGWWATVFPNIGFVLATISLGKAFKNETVLWFATVVSVGLVGVYLFVLGSHVRAVVVQDIMYPGRDEDVEDH